MPKLITRGLHEGIFKEIVVGTFKNIADGILDVISGRNPEVTLEGISKELFEGISKIASRISLKVILEKILQE